MELPSTTVPRLTALPGTTRSAYYGLAKLSDGTATCTYCFICHGTGLVCQDMTEALPW